jgi:TolB protein
MTAADAFKSRMKPLGRRLFLAIACGYFSCARLRHAVAEGGTGDGEPKGFSIVVPAASDSPTSTDAVWRDIAQGIALDLIASGRLVQIETNLSHPDEANRNPYAPPPIEKWRSTATEWLITGRASRPDQRLKVEFRLWNVATGQQWLGQQYSVQPEQWQSVAHICAQQILQRLNGGSDHFDVEKPK